MKKHVNIPAYVTKKAIEKRPHASRSQQDVCRNKLVLVPAQLDANTIIVYFRPSFGEYELLLATGNVTHTRWSRGGTSMEGKPLDIFTVDCIEIALT